jgi:hypothetical protein
MQHSSCVVVLTVESPPTPPTPPPHRRRVRAQERGQQRVLQIAAIVTTQVAHVPAHLRLDYGGGHCHISLLDGPLDHVLRAVLVDAPLDTVAVQQEPQPADDVGRKIWRRLALQRHGKALFAKEINAGQRPRVATKLHAVQIDQVQRHDGKGFWGHGGLFSPSCCRRVESQLMNLLPAQPLNQVHEAAREAGRHEVRPLALHVLVEPHPLLL